MSFPKRGRGPPGQCRFGDNCYKHNNGQCQFIHPDQPEWQTARPFISKYDDHGPGHRGRGNGQRGRGRGRGGVHWNDSHNLNGDNGGGHGGGYGAQSNNDNGTGWGATAPRQSSGSAWDAHDNGAPQTDSWGDAMFTESYPAQAKSSTGNAGWGNTAGQTEKATVASGEAGKGTNGTSWDDWDTTQPAATGWGASTNDNGGWGNTSPANDGWGWGNTSPANGGWGASSHTEGWGSSNANNTSVGWGQSKNNGPPTDGSVAKPENGGWSSTTDIQAPDSKGKGKMPVRGGDGWPNHSRNGQYQRRISSDLNQPLDQGWGDRRLTSQTSPPASRWPSGAQPSSSWQAVTNGGNDRDWGSQATGNNGWPQGGVADGDVAMSQPEPEPAPATAPPAPSTPSQQTRGSFASQLIDALFRSEDLGLAEVVLERTKRMVASPHYKKASAATIAKLESDLRNANENLSRKSDELLSRMRCIAQLPGAEQVFAQVDPTIELAWLCDGDLQKWAEVVEPAVRAHLGYNDAKTKQKVKTEGFDARPDWVKELPAYKNIKPISAEQAKAAAGDDKLLRAMIQTFGTDSPRIRQAVSVARAVADERVYGPQLDALEEEGARKRAKVAEMKKSLQEMKERDERRAQEEASRPSTSQSIAGWRHMIAANKSIYDKQTKQFEAHHAAYPQIMQQLDDLPPVDDVQAIAESLRPAMLESIQRLAGPRVDNIVEDARKAAEEQAREQARVLYQALQPVLVLMEYAKMQERKRAEAAEKQQFLEQERVRQDTQTESSGSRTQEPDVDIEPRNGSEKGDNQRQVPQEDVRPLVVQPQGQQQQLGGLLNVTTRMKSSSTVMGKDEVDELIDSPRASPSNSDESESDIRL